MTAPLLNHLLVMHPKVMFFNKPVSIYTNPPVFGWIEMALMDWVPVHHQGILEVGCQLPPLFMLTCALFYDTSVRFTLGWKRNGPSMAPRQVAAHQQGASPHSVHCDRRCGRREWLRSTRSKVTQEWCHQSCTPLCIPHWGTWISVFVCLLLLLLLFASWWTPERCGSIIRQHVVVCFLYIVVFF